MDNMMGMLGLGLPQGGLFQALTGSNVPGLLKSIMGGGNNPMQILPQQAQTNPTPMGALNGASPSMQGAQQPFDYKNFLNLAKTVMQQPQQPAALPPINYPRPRF